MKQRNYVYTKARPESAVFDLDNNDFDPGDLRVPRDVARRVKEKSLFVIRGEVEDRFRDICKRNLAEAQILIIKLQAIVRGNR